MGSTVRQLYREFLLAFCWLWSWNTWSILELGWILLEFSWATGATEEVSLAFVVGKHFCLGGLFDVDFVCRHDGASDFLRCFLGECGKHKSGSRERKNYFFHIQIPNVTKVTHVQYIHNALEVGIVPKNSYNENKISPYERFSWEVGLKHF